MPTPEVLPENETDSVAASAATPGTGIPDGTIWSEPPPGPSAAAAIPCITGQTLKSPVGSSRSGWLLLAARRLLRARQQRQLNIRTASRAFQNDFPDSGRKGGHFNPDSVFPRRRDRERISSIDVCGCCGFCSGYGIADDNRRSGNQGIARLHDSGNRKGLRGGRVLRQRTHRNQQENGKSAHVALNALE